MFGACNRRRCLSRLSTCVLQVCFIASPVKDLRPCTRRIKIFSLFNQTLVSYFCRKNPSELQLTPFFRYTLLNDLAILCFTLLTCSSLDPSRVRNCYHSFCVHSDLSLPLFYRIAYLIILLLSWFLK